MDIKRAMICILMVMIFGISFLNIGSENASAAWKDTIVVDFESGWNSSWENDDFDVNSGLDLWGISTQRAASGAHSLWCAQVGTNSVNSLANSANHYYDQSMDAWFTIPIGDISAYDSAEVSFSVWYDTGTFSLADLLWVGNSSDNLWYDELWIQTAVTSVGWEWHYADLPTCSTYVSFEFYSDPTVGLGPYEGVYIDDIYITLYDNTKPSSSLNPLPIYANETDLLITYSATDLGGSGIDYTELYYRFGTSDDFIKYTTTSNPSGHWYLNPFGVDTINFNFSGKGGDGQYQFYTVATDKLGNTEAVRAGPDDTIILDTVAPTLNILTPLNGNSFRSQTVNVSWQKSDNIGILNQEIEFDATGWATISGNSYDAELATGTHTIGLRVTDMAGNQVTKTVTISVDTDAFSFGGPYYGLPTIIIIAAIVIAGVFVFMRMRKRKKAPTIEPQTTIENIPEVGSQPAEKPPVSP